MKRLLLLAALTVFATNSNALTWSFSTVSVDSPPLKFLQSGDSTYTSTTGLTGTQFNLLGAGYNPATMVITSATVTFWFADDDSDGSETVDIYVNGTSVTGTRIFNDLEVDGSHPAANFAPYSANLQDFAGLIADLQDGIMSYQVKRQDGDTYLKIAEITATGNTTTVPDNGLTAAMLGLSLMGLFAARARSGGRR
jgi:hypothetical protein